MTDNFYKNRNLGLLLEAKAGNRKLPVCSSHLATKLNDRPATRQLHYSLLHYMVSTAFDPKEQIPFEKIKNTLYAAKPLKENDPSAADEK